MRLIIIAVMITYFIGCIIYLISNELNQPEVEMEGATFNMYFHMSDFDTDK